jgi:thymidylate synthase (FAD)
MLEEVRVLDHGYVRFVEHWGSDERIIESARMSTGKGFRSWYPYLECTHATPTEQCDAWWFEGHERPCEHEVPPREAKVGDEGLLSFLWKKGHATPFEMAGMQVEAQAPIVVFREWHRHRTQSYSEASARYGPLPAFDYVPTVERMLRNAGRNKQAQAQAGARELTPEAAGEWLKELEGVYGHAEAVYRKGLEAGVPKELARLSMAVGRYSKMRAQAVLRNWLAFLKLRYAADAQWEIAKYADAVRRMLADRFPRTMSLVSLPDPGL